MTDDQPFWKTKSLAEMDPNEWESLCDGCARCCLEKLEDADTGDIHHTNVACRLLSLKTCRCRKYADRKSIVPECQVLTPENIPTFKWMPSTCAYRLLSEGKDLPDWHPLLTGDPESTYRAGISVRGRVVSESDVWNLENHLCDWPK